MGPVDREVSFELSLINDNLALEFVEELSLDFEVNPAFQVIIDRALAAGEFIRDSAIVSIADNDGKTAEPFCICFNLSLSLSLSLSLGGGGGGKVVLPYTCVQYMYVR